MNKICHTYSIQMGTILGQIFCTFHKDGCILGRNFLYISVKWVHSSGKNVCTLGHKSVPEPSIMSKIHREPPPRDWKALMPTHCRHCYVITLCYVKNCKWILTTIIIINNTMWRMTTVTHKNSQSQMYYFSYPGNSFVQPVSVNYNTVQKKPHCPPANHRCGWPDTLIIARAPVSEGSSAPVVSRWLWPGSRTYLEVRIVVSCG